MVKFLNLSADQNDIDLREAGEVVKQGGVVVYPTETLYGLGADALNRGALREVCEMKGRGLGTPIPVIIADREALEELVTEVGGMSERLIEKFWPGPLTIVFDARESLPKELTAGSGTIGIRIPDSEIAVKLARAAGCPLTATSANATGVEQPDTPNQILQQLDKAPAMMIDAGVLRPSPPSTVVDARGGKVRILRRGAIPEKIVLDAVA